MSKIGRRPIDISNLQVSVKDGGIHFKGAKNSGVYPLPELFAAHIEGNKLTLVPNKEQAASMKDRERNRDWGLHRALLNNVLSGAKNEFEKIIEITGLGYKATQTGSKLVFSLGYSHKVDFSLPANVAISIDKTGQKLTLKSPDKEILGLVCDKICAFRPPEPYKGTGIKLSTQRIIRKVGKTK